MRTLFFFFSLCYAQLLFAAIPEGRWLTENFVADDGGYGSYYKGWVIISDGNVDQIITLGAHFDKIKFLILSDNGTNLEVLNAREGTKHRISYQTINDSLKVCVDSGACLTYQKVASGPVTGIAPTFHPKTSLSAKWCVTYNGESDCETVKYTNYQSEFLFNLVEGFNPARYIRYEGPVGLQKKYGIHLSVMSSSFRLHNDGSQLSSFSTSMTLHANNKNTFETYDRSGVIVLRTGLLASLKCEFQNRNIRVEFTLAERL